MGGNAFPDLNVVRLNSPEFFEFSNQLVESLNKTYPGCFAYIPAYQSKSSFGDLDILFNTLSPDGIIHFLNNPLTVRNGPVTSCALPYSDTELFQVDFIRVNWVEMDCALGYFSYNDLGNIIGRVARRAGFKLGHRGLSYVVREEGNESNMVEELFLTHSWKTSLEFLGYDHSEWLKGFETLEDVFRYCVSNPLASQRLFRLDQTSHAARIRDRKRKTYRDFLVWVGDPKNGVKFEESIPKHELRKVFLEKAFSEFPHFAKDYSRLQEQIALSRVARSKYNGILVRDLTGLEGKALGLFMRWIDNKLKLDGYSRVDWILKSTDSEIRDYIIKQSNTYQGVN